MDNGEIRPPSEDKPNFFVTRADKNEFNTTSILYNVLRFQGYPVRIEKLAISPDKAQEASEGKAIYVDTPETMNKIHRIRQEFKQNYRDLYNVFMAVSDGNPGIILREIQKKTQAAAAIPEDDKEAQYSSRREIDIYKECFLRSYDIRNKNNQETDAEAGIAPSIDIRAGVVAAYEAEDRKPIEPESLGILMMPVIAEIRKAHPELNPEV